MKTAIILTPSTVEELTATVQKLQILPEEFDSAEIVVVAEDSSGFTNEATIVVPDGLNFSKKANIARQLISDDVKALLFISDKDLITQEWVEGRLKAFSIEFIIGVVGKLYTVEEEVEKAIEEKLLSLLNITPEELSKRAKLPEGKFRVVDHANFSTTVDLWDKIGGLPQSIDPVSEYCIRAQALGFGILPQIN